MNSKRTYIALALGLLSSVCACGGNTLSNPRAHATATLLPDGEVLVAGGSEYKSFLWTGGTKVLASAERYDPESGTWRPTGSMAVDRYGHTATALPSGRVLVAGGISGYLAHGILGSTSRAELYEPERGTWSPTGPMTQARTGHQATLLADGRVLVTGGAKEIYASATAAAEVYDPEKGVWFPVTSMRTPRTRHAATALPDGTVLVTGGMNQDSHLKTAEIYDPVSNTWSPTGSMRTSRSLHVLTPLPDGKVLVTGATHGELYDPATGAWTDVGNWMDFYCDQHTATPLLDGRVLVAGGGSGMSSPHGALDGTALYVPETHSWAANSSLPEPRTGHSAVLLRDGRVLVVGGETLGENGAYVTLDTTVLFDPGTGTWK